MKLIDKDALTAKLEITDGCLECKWVNGAYCTRWKTFVDACEAIFDAPVIEQPEIVRCKDCKHNPNESWFGCPMSHLSEEQRPETAWCWKGERKDENQD